MQLSLQQAAFEPLHVLKQDEIQILSFSNPELVTYISVSQNMVQLCKTSAAAIYKKYLKICCIILFFLL